MRTRITEKFVKHDTRHDTIRQNPCAIWQKD